MARQTLRRRRLVRLELGDAGRDVVLVLDELDGGRIRVRFNSGAELVIPEHLTSTISTEEHHDQQQRRPHRPQQPSTLDI